MDSASKSATRVDKPSHMLHLFDSPAQSAMAIFKERNASIWEIQFAQHLYSVRYSLVRALGGTRAIVIRGLRMRSHSQSARHRPGADLSVLHRQQESGHPDFGYQCERCRQSDTGAIPRGLEWTRRAFVRAIAWRSRHMDRGTDLRGTMTARAGRDDRCIVHVAGSFTPERRRVPAHCRFRRHRRYSSRRRACVDLCANARRASSSSSSAVMSLPGSATEFRNHAPSGPRLTALYGRRPFVSSATS